MGPTRGAVQGRETVVGVQVASEPNCASAQTHRRALDSEDECLGLSFERAGVIGARLGAGVLVGSERGGRRQSGRGRGSLGRKADKWRRAVSRSCADNV